MDPLGGDCEGSTPLPSPPSGFTENTLFWRGNVCVVLVAEDILPASHPMTSIIRRSDGGVSIAGPIAHFAHIPQARGRRNHAAPYPT